MTSAHLSSRARGTAPFASFMVSVLLLGGAVLFSTSANSAGISVGDQGAVAAGRGGAFVAKADDFSAVEYNPAGLASQRGWQIYLSNRFGYADERFKRSTIWDYSEEQVQSFEEVSNQKPWQLLGPMLGVSTDFGLDNWAFALGIYAPSGIASQRFPADGGQRYMLTGRDTKILYYNLSLAWKHKDVFGIGLSLQWVDLAQLDLRLAVNGDISPALVTPVSNFWDMEAHVEGADHVGFSGIVGMWLRPVPAFHVALSSRFVPTRFNADATLTLSPMDSNFNGTTEVTRDDSADNNVVFSMTMPMEFRLGFRYIHLRNGVERFDLELDLRLELWSQMDKFEVDGDGLDASIEGIEQPVPIGIITIPKKWKNTFSARLGSDVTVVEKRLSLRAGAFFESAAASKEYAYVDFLASHRIGGSLGASVYMGNFELALSYSYVIEVPFTVKESEGKIFQQVPGSPCEGPNYDDSGLCDENYSGQPAATVNNGVFISTYHFSSLAVSYRF
jgi:long-chain fatty acid transport protein